MTGTEDKFAMELLAAVKQGLQQAVRDKLVSNYGDSPFVGALNKVVAVQSQALLDMLVNCITGAVGDPEFVKEIQATVRARLAKILVERFGGELEKQVNLLKSNPATRAKLTLAIEEIAKGAVG